MHAKRFLVNLKIIRNECLPNLQRANWFVTYKLVLKEMYIINKL